MWVNVTNGVSVKVIAPLHHGAVHLALLIQVLFEKYLPEIQTVYDGTRFAVENGLDDIKNKTQRIRDSQKVGLIDELDGLYAGLPCWSVSVERKSNLEKLSLDASSKKLVRVVVEAPFGHCGVGLSITLHELLKKVLPKVSIDYVNHCADTALNVTADEESSMRAVILAEREEGVLKEFQKHLMASTVVRKSGIRIEPIALTPAVHQQILNALQIPA